MNIRVLIDYGWWVKGNTHTVKKTPEGLFVADNGIHFRAHAHNKAIIRWVCK
jgi:hypothetical protein